jgi:hypothetical protein
MKIDFNKKYTMKDGTPVVLTGYHGEFEYPVWGYVESLDGDANNRAQFSWTKTGKAIKRVKTNMNLVEVTA